MVTAFLSLVGCQLIGELIREVLHLPIPGPVIGMFLLVAVLALYNGSGKIISNDAPTPLEQTAETLISHMGLLFVPAGVGLIAEVGVLQREWLPIVAGLLGSTVLSIAVTGLVMHWTAHSPE
jgi:putative effector of murein hydrolase LrgA (UPF0299 family)